MNTKGSSTTPNLGSTAAKSWLWPPAAPRALQSAWKNFQKASCCFEKNFLHFLICWHLNCPFFWGSPFIPPRAQQFNSGIQRRFFTRNGRMGSLPARPPWNKARCSGWCFGSTTEPLKWRCENGLEIWVVHNYSCSPPCVAPRHRDAYFEPMTRESQDLTFLFLLELKPTFSATCWKHMTKMDRNRYARRKNGGSNNKTGLVLFLLHFNAQCSAHTFSAIKTWFDGDAVVPHLWIWKHRGIKHLQPQRNWLASENGMTGSQISGWLRMGKW